MADRPSRSQHPRLLSRPSHFYRQDLPPQMIHYGHVVRAMFIGDLLFGVCLSDGLSRCCFPDRRAVAPLLYIHERRDWFAG